ncbi:MAG: hypothetical protein NTV24_03900 [Candidatus Woesebacteria bacterium]|nr:hypothetical protein [Candidatus Woesebacteria bacterium]
MKKKNLDPKIEVTANLEGLTKPQFVVITGGIAQAAIDNPTVAPTTLDPTPAALKAEVQIMAALMVAAQNLVQQLRNNTELINKSLKIINDFIVSGWVPEIQKKVTNPEDIKLLGFGIKGVFDGHSGSGVSITNSKPDISNVEYRHLEHILTFRNNITGHIGLPYDGLRIDIYEYIGTTEPTDIKKMTYIGSASRGKFTNHFTEDQLGQKVWYIAVYVGKKSAADGSSELSVKVQATVV